MGFLEQIEKDYLRAYKAKETVTVSVLRHVKTSIKNRQVELLRPLEDEEVLAIFLKEAKQRKESIVQYVAAARADLQKIEEDELIVLSSYLPKVLSEEEFEKVVVDTITKLGAKTAADMGAVMKELTTAYKGQFDGKVASDLVRKKLS